MSIQAFSPSELSAVRSEFPSLAESNQCIFMDNAGGTQVLKRVADYVYDCLIKTSVQPGASYSTSQAISDRILEARRAVASLINAAHDEEVVMGGSTTLLMFLIIQAILPTIVPGDEIILTNSEHEANVGAWKRLAQAGAIIKIWEVNPQTLHLDLATLDGLLTSRTKWVAMTHTSNVLGTVNPVVEVAKRVHAVGGRLSVDAVAYAPHRLVDVQASGADLYVFSIYKLFGPHTPFSGAPRAPLESSCYGIRGVVDYLVHMGQNVFNGSGSHRELMQKAYDRFEQHENALTEKLLAFLRSKAPKVRIIGLPTLTEEYQGLTYSRVATVSFVVEGFQTPDIVSHIDNYNIGIRHGDFYAVHLVDSLGLRAYGGVTRVSLAHYNTLEEVDKLISHLSELF
ncbi:hypothetical protein AeMF1_012876 [Aphanomyces euteiches]|nr:hypothetical protein AeMF1_012876 [Aphanomyces euteiches]